MLLKSERKVSLIGRGSLRFFPHVSPHVTSALMSPLLVSTALLHAFELV